MITLAGVGPGNPKYLTEEVRKEIKCSEHIIAFGRVGQSLEELNSSIIKVKRVTEIIDEIEKNKDKEILILASGDPTFYGIINYLEKNQIKLERVLPGLSSFQYMMARIKMPWQEANLFSLHGRDYNLENIRENRINICLTDGINTPSKISSDLKKLDIRGIMYVGYNLSYEDEKIIGIKIGDEIEDISELAVVVIINEMD